jgi:hypothetical protein
MGRPEVAARDLTETRPMGIARPIMQMAASMLSDEAATIDDIRAVAVLLHCTLGDALQVIESMQHSLRLVTANTSVDHST